MGKAKGKWLLALLALAFAAILAAVLCMNFPMAEVHAETAVAKVTAATGETQTYEKLSDAFMAAKDGDTIDILQDASENSEADLAYGYGEEGEGGVWMFIQDKSLTINGNGHTLTSNTAAWAMYVINTEGKQTELTLNDLTIDFRTQKVNYGSPITATPITLFNGGITLNLNNVTLDSTESGGGNVPTILSSGQTGGNVINVRGGSRLLAKQENGYAFWASKPVTLTVDNSTLSGWSALYMTGKSNSLGTAGSEVVIQNGSTLESFASAALAGGQNEFGTIVFEMGGVDVTVKDSEIVATAEDGAPAQGIVFYSDQYVGDGNPVENVTVNFENTDIEITGGVELTYGAGDNSPEGGSTPAAEAVTLAGGSVNVPVEEQYIADGYALVSDGEGYSVLTEEAVADYMAYITGKDGTVVYYETLQAAFDSAADDDVIVVARDITTDTVLVTKDSRNPLDASVTLDLNGKKIVATGSSYAFTIAPTTSLTVTSSTGNATVVANQAMQIRAMTNPTVEILIENIDFSGTITGNSAIYLNKYGAVEKQNVTLNNVTAVYDNNVGAAITGVVEATGGTHLTVKDSRIEVTNVAAERSRPFIGVYLNNTASTSRGTASSAVIENSTVIANKTAGSEKGSQWGVGIGAYTYDLTVSGGTVTSTDGAGITFYGGVMIDSAAELLDAGNTESFKTLNLEGGVAVSGYTFAVSGNGSSTEANSGTVINVGSATLKGELGVGIYQPQVGILNINAGANIQGSSGIEIRAGELNVTGGNITATWEKLQTYPKQAGSGTSIDGAAIAISQHSTNKPIFVNIIDGNFTGPVALYEEDLLNEVANEQIEADITGGTFTSTQADMPAVSSENMDSFVSGGKFNTALEAKDLGENIAQIEGESGFTVGKTEDLVAEQNAVAMVEETGVAYETLQAAVDAAADGDVVVVIKDITTSSALIKNTISTPLAAEIVIDLNGKTITATGSGYYLFELIPTTSLTITSSTGNATIVANQAMQIRAYDAPTVDIFVENIDFSGTITDKSAIYLNKYGAVEKQNVTLNNVTAVYDNNVGAAITGVVEATGGTHLTVKDSRIEVTNVAAERSRPFIGVYLNNTASTSRGTASSAVIENSTVIANKTAGSEKGSQWGVGIGAYTYDLTVSGGTVTSTDGAGITFYGGVMIDSAAELLDAGNTESFKTLNLEGGVAVSGYTFAVSGNGSSTEANSGTVINVGSATLKGELGVGIYQPQVGILNINAGANIQGSSGIEIRAGELNVTGGNITATWEKLQTYPKQAGSGTSIDGAAIAISQHSTNKPIFVNIIDGNFTGPVALYEEDLLNEVANEQIEADITGGTFTSTQADMPAVSSENMDSFVSGGTFTEPVPAAYLEDGFTLTVGDGTYGVEEADELATVTRGEAVYNFATLAEALTFAEDGDTVTLLEGGGISEALTIDKDITFDLNDVTLYVNGAQGIVITADGVTVTGGSIIASAETRTAVYIDGAKDVLLEDVKIKANVVAVGAENGADVTLQNSTVDVKVLTNSGSANAIEIICSDMEIIDSVVTCVAEPTTLTGTVCTAIFIEGTYGSDREAAAAADPATYSHLKISGNNTKITARAYAIVGNGTLHGTDIDILGGTIESTNSIAIYHPQVGELTISGNTQITGCSGLEMRAGSLVIEGDGVSVTATDPFMESPLSDGFRFAGVAVGVSRYFAEEGTGVSVSIEGGTFTATNEEGYAFYEKVDEEHAPAVTPDNQDNLSVSIAGGTFEGKVESTNVTGFISGGMFKYRPAEDYMDPDFVTELQNGYYVPVESSALRAAQTNAQADVREYVAMLGMKWAEVLELEGEGDENAVALVAAYNAIADTTSEKGVAKARLDAMDAADAFAAAQEDAWEQAKADKIAELESWRDENANGLVIPRYIYTAMNSAADEEELNSYFEQAKAEIGDIYAYRNQITAQSEDLQTLKDTLTALNGALTGENNSFDELLANVEEAIGKAQSAIIGTDADSDSLAGIRDYLEKTINAALEGIDDAISGTNGIASELAGISDVLNGFTSKLDTITGALDEETGWIAEAIEKAQGDITSILAALDSLADSTDIEAIADSLAQILEDIAAVQGTVDEIEGEVSAVSSVQEAKDEALTDIGEWLNNYLDSIIGGTDEANGGAAVALAFTAETTDGDIYAKLTKVFSEDNAQLVLRYYNEALASIDAATTVSEVTTAVSTFKAQVASVEAAAQNTTNLTGLYVLLVIVLVAVVVVLVIVIVKKNRSAEAAEQPAEEAEQPVPAEAVPAAEPEQPEPAAEENELAAEADDDKEQVVIAANVRSFSEAYVELNEELLDLFNKVKEYALAKDGAAEVKQSNGICIKRNGKQIVKLTVRRGYPVALFFLENEMLKDFRRTTNTNAKLKIRATELVLREAADLEAAYTMVDLSVEQIDKDIENAKERRREARRARRKQKQLEEEAQQQEIAAGSAENGENERP